MARAVSSCAGRREQLPERLERTYRGADVAPTSFISLTPATPVNPSGWTLLSWTATVSWTGTLSSATLYVETSTGTDSFFLDDASLQ